MRDSIPLSFGPIFLNVSVNDALPEERAEVNVPDLHRKRGNRRAGAVQSSSVMMHPVHPRSRGHALDDTGRVGDFFARVNIKPYGKGEQHYINIIAKFDP